MKKPIYKKWWFWVIIAILVIGIGNSGDNNTANISSEPTAQQEEVVIEETKVIDKTNQITIDIQNVGFNSSAVDIVLESIPNVKEKYEKLEQHAGIVWYLYTSDNKYFLIKDSVNDLARISTTEKEIEKRTIYYNKKYN